jgi:HPt (histidine-containing phosphotransfer) domain-containing protein
MTFGDRRLEHDVLELFACQASLLLTRMRQVDAAGIAGLAHTLKGSARGVGAQRVAHAAEQVERLATHGRAELGPALATLEAATKEARAMIADLLCNNDR